MSYAGLMLDKMLKPWVQYGAIHGQKEAVEPIDICMNEYINEFHFE
jgi:hypothetical protein